jgi:hypothetical protein
VASIGDAWIDVHANTSPFDRELDRDLTTAATKSEKSLNRTGKDFGDKIVNSMSKRLGERGREFGKSIERATKTLVINVKSKINYDRHSVRDFFRRLFHRKDFGDTISQEVGAAFDDMGRRGGVFSKLTQGIADAVGAGFNVSGRSPLIAILIPAILALVGVVLAAVQAVNALVAVLFIVPGLLASIGLQVGVVMIAFQGMGEAIKGAFAAKNAKELKSALKDLTPSARDFVKELLPLRSLFRDIGRTVQEKFFAKLTGVITAIRKSLGPSLIKGFGTLASAAGQFFEDFGLLLASPGFKNFFNKIIPATARWLDKFGMSLFGRRGFVTALIAMATALMPFMMQFGDIILRNLDHLAGLIFQLASSPTTQKWLDDMAVTLQLVFDLLFKVGEFLFVFMKQLNDAGGTALFDALQEALDQLIFFFGSPAGAKAMEAMINLGIIGIKTITGLVILIAGLLAAFQVLAEWLKDVFVPEWGKTLKNIGQAIVNAATFVGVWLTRIVNSIRGFFKGIGSLIVGTKDLYVRMINAIIAKIKEWGDRIGKIPSIVTSKFKNFGSLLINAGRALIQGLINGVNQKIGSLLNILRGVASKIAGFFPGSPAKEGPLSGRGYVLYRGQRMMQDFMKGIQMEVPRLRETTMNATSNIVFGANSIRMEFNGSQPDQNQARTVGSAMGMSAANMIAARNTRLAVRTL